MNIVHQVAHHQVVIQVQVRAMMILMPYLKIMKIKYLKMEIISYMNSEGSQLKILNNSVLGVL
jgi:hypothetical protein